jgi:hypothetical protein
MVVNRSIEMPEKTSGCFNQMLFLWLNPLISQAVRTGNLEEEDIWSTRTEDNCEARTSAMQTIWERLLQKHQPAAGKHILLRAIMLTRYRDFALCAFYKVIAESVDFVQAVLLGEVTSLTSAPHLRSPLLPPLLSPLLSPLLPTAGKCDRRAGCL